MAWSENYKYKNPDITGLVDNVKKMMGVDSGAAGRRSRNMSDYLTGAKTEGQMFRNQVLDMISQLKRKSFDNPDLTDDQKLGRGLSTSFGDTALGVGREEMLASQLAEQEGKAQLQKQAVDKGNLIASLAKRLEVDGSPEHAKRVMTMPQGLPGSNVTVPARGYSEGDQERWARLIRTLQGGQVGTDMDYSGARGKSETTGKVGLFEARTTAAKNLGVANVELANKRTAEVLARTGNAGKLNAEKIKEIQDRVLINWNQGFQQATTAKKRRELLDQTIKTELQRTLGAKETVAKKKAETSMAQLELDELPTTLSYLRETYKQKKRKAAELARIAETDAKAAQELTDIKIEIAKLDKAIKEHGKGKAEAQEKTAESKETMTSMDLAGYKEKLKNLKEQREDLLAKGKILLENAKTDKQRKELDLEIKKELRPLEKEIKELAIEMADVNIRSKSRESLTKTQSPSEVERANQFKLEQIEAKKRSNSGSGSGTTTEELIEARMGVTNGEGTSTTGGLPAPVSKKSMPPDPEAKSVLNELLAVPPEQLLGWTEEDIEKAVAMIQQNFPNMHPERIKRLIGIQQNRSK